MGAKLQTLGDESHPEKYKEIIDGLKENKFHNITFITGAGIINISWNSRFSFTWRSF